MYLRQQLSFLLFFYLFLVVGEEYEHFRCFECDSRISLEDCDENSVARNCVDNAVFMDGEEWYRPRFDRCLKIVDETKDPPWYYRRCGFYGLFLHYIREKCHRPLCTIESCSEPLCLIGNIEAEEKLYSE